MVKENNDLSCFIPILHCVDCLDDTHSISVSFGNRMLKVMLILTIGVNEAFSIPNESFVLDA